MNNELKHYGIPGMRWGHRKATRTKSRSTKSVQKGKKVAAGILAGIGTAAVATVAAAAITRKAAINKTVLGMFGNK